MAGQVLKPMLTNFAKNHLLLLVFTLPLISQCSVTESQMIEAPKSQPPAVKKEAPPVHSAANTLEQARDHEGSSRQQALILAADKALQQGQWRQARSILSQTQELSVSQQDEKNILLAKIAKIRGQPEQVLAYLSKIEDKSTLNEYWRIQNYELAATTYQQTNNPLAAVQQRINLHQLLTDGTMRKRNARQLWLNLGRTSSISLRENSNKTSANALLQGWLQLALIARQNQHSSLEVIQQLKQWQHQFPLHPANEIFPENLDTLATQLISSPQQIALLLPLSGPLQGPGKAIKEGFLAARKNSAQGAGLSIKTYDTNNAEVVHLYQQAVQEGAHYIIGPLTKAQVAAVAAIEHPVPTLLLNEGGGQLPAHTYTLSLSPRDEALQIANQAHNQGYKRALIIAPDSSWGDEIVTSFTKQWQKKGAQVTEVLHYKEHDDLNKKIKNFLHVDLSLAREKKLKEVLGSSLVTVSNRRQDFDMLFLIAYPTKARQIMPLLRYYYVQKMPIYATASAYGGFANAIKDKDLEGLTFCDLPWVFGHQAGIKNWPEQFNSYNRLFALGQQSFIFMTRLNHLILFPIDEAEPGDGALYLRASHRVARVLEWGQFRQGLAHSLGEAVI